MPAPLKIAKAAERHKLPPDEMILKLLNELQTPQAVAKHLRVHPRTVNRYIEPRFHCRCVWEPKPDVIDAYVIDARAEEVSTK